MMGFNTDVIHNGVVYHVQTEPRKDGGIETIVYTQGAVIRKFKSAWQDLLNSPDANKNMLKRVLEDQHRQVIARIRAGQIVPPASPSVSS